MKSMFWKLFFSFLLTIFLGGGLSVLAISTFFYLSPLLLEDENMKRMDDQLTKMIISAGKASEQIYRYGGPGEYRKFIDELEKGTGIRLFLVDSDNRELADNVLTSEQITQAGEAWETAQPVLTRAPGAVTVSTKLFTEKSDSPVVVGVRRFGPSREIQGGGRELRLFPGPMPPFFMKGEMIKAGIMLLMLAGVCYLLARSLSLPLQRLQQAARRIARGDYSARVGTGLGRAGNEIADLGREFDIMAERTEKVIHSQNRLLRDISHELRSPLARLNVALELARQHCRVEGDKALNQIGREADRLNDLIGQLLILTRLESGGELPGAEPVQLADLVAEVAEDVNFEALTHNRAVRVVSTLPVIVFGSRELLRRAVENITRNGARFTAEGTSVDVSLTIRGEEAVLSVEDSGPGVTEKDLPHLFEPFYRVAEARERKSGGVGIGLTIARQAIRAHGGEVIMKNRSDTSGLSVTISLPLAS